MEEIKRTQKHLLEYTTVDPPRFQYQVPAHGVGKNLISMMHRGTRGTNAQGIEVVNFGSWMPDPRGTSRQPISGPYMWEKMKQRREPYLGPCLLTCQTNDYNPTPSVTMNRYKSKSVREYGFRRREMEDIVAIGVPKQHMNNCREPNGILDVEREISRSHQVITADILVGRNDNYHHNTNPEISRECTTKTSNTTFNHRMQPNDLNRNIQEVQPFGNTRQKFDKIQASDLVNVTPSNQCIVNTHNKNTINQIKVNDILMIDSYINECNQSKVPFSKSKFLTHKQKLAFNECLQNGLTEQCLVNILSKTCSTIRKTCINNNQFVTEDIIQICINNHSKNLTRKDRLLLLNILTVESQSSIINTFNKTTNIGMGKNDNYVLNDEDIYDDLGMPRKKAHYTKQNNYDMTIGSRPIDRKQQLKLTTQVLNGRQDINIPTYSRTLVNQPRSTSNNLPSNSLNFSRI
jgi:hypothetical protein